ncbi:MAG: hypothetical protein IK113_05705 [Bacteroidales bacterium]|nr:hypothetical protein [Bacteroidales bacterium]
MKKILIFMAAAILTAGSFTAKAQGRTDVNLYMGFMNAAYTSLDQAGGRYSHRDLYSIYEPYYTVNSGPSFTLDVNRRILPWLGAGLQANYSYMSGEKKYNIGNAPKKEFSQTMLAFLPQVKFFIPSPRHFRLYAKAAAGINLNLGETIVGEPISFAWDIVPIGFEWGGQFIYGTAEFCAGNVITGARVGLGFRF